MSVTEFFAVTKEELPKAMDSNLSLAYFSCWFSLEGALENLPQRLPKGSLLMLDDRNPPPGGKLQNITQTLSWLIQKFACRGLILDFQRPGLPENHAIARALQALPCPVAVTPPYAPENCPVFVPPIAPYETPAEWLKAYQGREIWLELALDSACLQLTRDGCQLLPQSGYAQAPFYSEELHSHYGIRIKSGKAQFNFQRTKKCLPPLLEQGKALGVTLAVGLYREFWKK